MLTGRGAHRENEYRRTLLEQSTSPPGLPGAALLGATNQV